MDPAPHTPTAGQATVEYVAVIALVALLLAFVAPVVGGPDLPHAVSHQIRLGICVVAHDVCSADEAKAANLAPCTLKSRTDGRAVGVSAVSIDLGGNQSLTIAPQSDGSVSVTKSAGVSVGGSGGLGVDLNGGPVAFSVGLGGAVEERFQKSRGWSFPDAVAAQRFLDRLPVSLMDTPSSWWSGDVDGDLSLSEGITAGGKESGADLAALAASATGVLGARHAADGTITIYAKAAFELPEGSIPLVPSVSPGRHDYSIETSFLHGAPRELVIRTADQSHGGNQVTDTVVHLDLRDPANLAVARGLLSARSPSAAAQAGAAVVQRARAAGVIERSESALDDTSYSASGGVKLGVHIGGYYKRIKVRKDLLHASAWVDGSDERERYDCELARRGG